MLTESLYTYEVLPLEHVIGRKVREAFARAGLTYRPGQIAEPILKSIAPQSPAAKEKAAAMATENQRLVDDILARRDGAHD